MSSGKFRVSSLFSSLRGRSVASTTNDISVLADIDEERKAEQQSAQAVRAKARRHDPNLGCLEVLSDIRGLLMEILGTRFGSVPTCCQSLAHNPTPA